MYNTQFICTYQNNKDNYELSEEENEDYANKLYQNDFLRIFEIDDYCDDIINTTMNEIYAKLIKFDNIIDLLNKMAASFFSEDLEIGLMVAFSYDYFFLMHPCVCELLEKGEISEEKLSELKIAIEKNMKK